MSISNPCSSLSDATILIPVEEQAKEYLPHLRELPMFCPQMDKWDHQQTSCYKQKKSSICILNLYAIFNIMYILIYHILSVQL